MKNTNATAEQTAKFLLQVKAVKLNNENPFTWASGRKSPIYCDNRVTLSYPPIRTFIRQGFVEAISAMSMSSQASPPAELLKVHWLRKNWKNRLFMSVPNPSHTV